MSRDNRENPQKHTVNPARGEVTVCPGLPVMLEIPPELAGERLDKALAVLIRDVSRATLQQWLRDGRVRVDGSPPRQRDRLRGGEVVRLDPPPPAPTAVRAQAITVEVLHEDRDLLVVNKPPGLVVHPGAGNPDGTLVNALVHFDPALGALPRAGIVHRLDKDTSGLLIVARSEGVRQRLIAALERRIVHRAYVAVVCGVMVAGGRVAAPIGRHSRDRRRMAVTERGKTAVSHYRVLERYRGHTCVRVTLETGRTHQIRVHLAHAGYPIVGDPTYGGRLRLPPGALPVLVDALRGFRRQALHAARLEFAHPTNDRLLVVESPLPDDIRRLREALREDARAQDRK